MLVFKRAVSVLLRFERAPFEAAISVAAVAAFVTWVLNPGVFERSAIGRTARTLFPVWQVLYGIGGATILFALARQSVRSEVAGLAVFSGALLVNAVALVDYNGVATVVSASVFTALGAACVLRTRYLVHRWRELRDRSQDDA